MSENLIRTIITIKDLLGIPIGNRLIVKEDDCFIVSYPKSGNTWMRFLIANLISNEQIDFLNIENIIPAINVNTNRKISKLTSPRFINCHQPFDFRYKKVIYIIRDGRDVAVSYYFYLKKMANLKLEFSDYLENFVSGKLDNFGSWGENVLSWTRTLRDEPNRFLAIRYEDLLLEPNKEVEKICSFLDLKATSEEINCAVANSKFSKMAEIEKKQERKASWFKNSNKEIKFVRNGKSGGWKDIFTEGDKQTFKRYFGALLIELKYEEDLNW